MEFQRDRGGQMMNESYLVVQQKNEMGQDFSPENQGLVWIIYFNISSSSGQCVYRDRCDFLFIFLGLRIRVTAYMNRVTVWLLVFRVPSCLWASVLHYSWGCFNGFLEVLQLVFHSAFFFNRPPVMALKSPYYLFLSLDQPAVFPEVDLMNWLE